MPQERVNNSPEEIAKKQYQVDLEYYNRTGKFPEIEKVKQKLNREQIITLRQELEKYELILKVCAGLKQDLHKSNAIDLINSLEEHTSNIERKQVYQDLLEILYYPSAILVNKNSSFLELIKAITKRVEKIKNDLAECE